MTSRPHFVLRTATWKRFRDASRRSLVGGVAAATAIAVAAVGAPSAYAAAGDTSRASARFLSGSLLLNGELLDDVAALAGESSTNNGNAAPVINTGTLDLTAVNLLNVTLPNGLSVPLGQLLSLGAVNQYAEADDAGVSRAAAGAVNDTGVVDTTGGGAFPSNATLDLISLLGPLAGDGVLSTAQLSVNAISAVAALDGSQLTAPATTCTDLSDPTHCRDYNVGSATLNLDSPLVGGMVASVNTTLDAVSTTLNTTLEGLLVNGVLAGVNDVLALLDALVLGDLSIVSNTLTATVNADLRAAVAGVLSQTLTDGVVSINLATGAIDVDLDALTGDLNNRAPNTSVLTASVLTNLVDRIGVLLGNGPTGLQAQLADAVDTALDAVTVSIGGGICLLRVLGACTAGLSVSYDGTLGELAGGAAPIGVDGSGLLGGLLIGATLDSVSAALQLSLAAVVGPVLTQGLSSITSTATNAVTALISDLNPVLLALDDVVMLTVNVQEPGATAGSYREVALRVSAISGGLATIDLARAEVGANFIVPAITGLSPDHGPLVGGNTVTVNGEGFIDGSAVSFDGATITPDSTSPDGTSLTFTVPAGTLSGPVPVTVSNTNGTSVAATYTYGAPTLNAAPSAAPGGLLELVSSGWPPSTLVTVQLYAPGGAPEGTPATVTTTASGAFPASTTITVPGDALLGNHTVTATDGAGDSASDTFAVSVVAITALDPDAGPIAGGQTVTVYGTGFVIGETSVTIGATTIPAASVTVDAGLASLTFSTPAHTAGAVNVTASTTTDTSNALVYTYVAVPTAGSLNPVAGPAAGGQTVTVTGTGFTDDSTVTIGGAPVYPATVAPDGTSLTFTTPAHAAGAVDVTVTTPGGTTSPALAYTYFAAPTLSSLWPNEGPIAGGQTVTIDGTGFTADATVTIGGSTVTPTSVTATSLEFTTPAHAAGTVDVTVTTPGGTSAPLTYTYLAVPTATFMDPNAGPTAGGQTVEITGSGFAEATTVAIDVTAVPATVGPGGTSLTFVTPAHAAGAVDVTVTTFGGTSDPLTYTYVPPPTATSLSPSAGPEAGGQTVTISGTGFTSDSSVFVDGVEVVPASVAPDGLSLTYLTPAHAAGAVDVTVTTPGGTTTPALTYTYLPIPVASTITPNAGPIAGGQTVTVSGANFADGTTVTIGGTAVTPESLALDGTSLTFVTPAHAAGPVNVTVTNASGTSGPLGYTYLAVPTAESISPDSGPVAGGQTATIEGSGFVAGATTVTIGGATIPVGAITVVPGGTSLSFLTPAHGAGTVDVTVTTLGGTTTPALTYEYLAVPTATGLTPDAGPVAGGTSVTVTGTGFVAGDTTVTIGGTILPAGSVTVTPGGLSLTFSTPAHAAGTVDVTIATPGGTTTPALSFTYLPVPTISLLSPDAGPFAGGQTVTVTGTGFVPGATTVTIGATVIPAVDVTVGPGGTSLTFVTPPHAVGPVEVSVSTAGGTSNTLPYDYAPIPTIGALDPDDGPTAGGQTVTVTGLNFLPDSVVTVDGVDVTPTAVAPETTSLTFTTPAHAAGPVEITVRTSGGTTFPLTYTYVPAPTASSIDPVAGPAAGGQTVIITGTNFTADATVTIGGTAVTPTLALPTSLTLTTPAHAAGPVSVTVTTAGGTTAPLSYTYLAAPVLSTVTPDAGPLPGGQTVTLSGSGFTAESVVTIGGVIAVPSEVSADGTSLTFTTPAHVAGVVDVTVTTLGGTSGPLPYTYVAPPVGLTISPSSGPDTGGQSVTITGSDFTASATVTIGGNTVAPAAVAADGTSLTFVTPAHAAGAVTVTVETTGGTCEPLAYTYLPVPGASALSPNAGPAAGGQTVTISGRNFTAGSSVSIGGMAATVATVAPDGTSLTFVTPAHAAGPVQVTVTTAHGTTPALIYTYLAAPLASTIAPDHGPVSGGQSVTITGSGFTAEAEVTIGGTAVTPTSVSDDGASLTFTTPAHAPGTVAVRVQTPGGTTDPLDYTYEDEQAPDAPVITEPTDGATVTDDTPPISGTGRPGASVDVVDNGSVICTATVDAQGTWSCTPSTDLPYGGHTITARQRVHELTSDFSDPVTFTVTGGPSLGSTGPATRSAIAVTVLLLLLGAGFLFAGGSRARVRR